MKNRRNIIYLFAGLMLLLQVALVIRYWIFGNIHTVNWILFVYWIAILGSIVIDPLGEHAPKMSRIGWIKLILLMIAMLLAGFDLGRTF